MPVDLREESAAFFTGNSPVFPEAIHRLDTISD
jgi:hypothetical protein